MKPMLTLAAAVALSGAAGAATAGDAQVAVAANFAAPMKAIAAAFQADAGHTLKVSYGATGKFYAQIRNGAPFDVLVSADTVTPNKLVQEGLATADSRMTYAIGRLVLWSATPGVVDDQGAILKSGDFNKLALANPKVAPYGAAAIEVLERLGVRAAVAPKFVTGENIAQTFQFIDSGNALIGFIALSQVTENGELSRGSAWIVPADLHAPIRQDAVILRPGADNPAATALLAYLQGERARDIIRAFGYELP